MSGPRTFRVDSPPMKGEDVAAWQEWLNRQMRVWDVAYSVSTDGVYGAVTRDLTASVCHGLGLSSAAEAMAQGVTPELRVKLRNKRLSKAELARFEERAGWRRAFRRRHADRDVSPPVARILSSSWGFHPGVHDGVDLITQAHAAGLAICRAKVIRADNGGWWGKGAPSDPSVRAKGDGILVLRCLVDAGPFRRGLNFAYGHAERVRVSVGEVVDAGQVVCEAGLANAWHFHFMVNGRDDARGVGDRDPMPFVRYAQRNG